MTRVIEARPEPSSGTTPKRQSRAARIVKAVPLWVLVGTVSLLIPITVGHWSTTWVLLVGNAVLTHQDVYIGIAWFGVACLAVGFTIWLGQPRPPLRTTHDMRHVLAILGWLAALIAAMATIIATPFTVSDSWGSYSAKLGRASPQGCRVAVHVNFYFYTNTTTVYVGAPHSPLLHQTSGGWQLDAAIGDPTYPDPIRDGDWTLTWNDTGSVLTAAGQDTAIPCPPS